MRMKILIVTQYFPPEMGAPQARLYELSVKFLEDGHEVTVLTGMPNYPEGRIFAGYRGRARVVEQMAGIRVIRAWLFPSKSTRSVPRLMSYLSFALSSTIVGLWSLRKHDVAIVESPPLFLAPSGWLMSKWTGARKLLMVSDIWPDILVRMGHAREGLSLRAMLWLEQWAYRHFDVVAVTNPGAMEQISARFPDVQTTVISNGVDRSQFNPAARSERVRTDLGADENTFLVGYCGLHGLAQGLEAVIDAASHLKGRSEIRFVLVGEGPVKDRLLAAARTRGLTNVAFIDRRPKDDMPAIVASCDAMLVPLSSRLPGTMPSKIYEALAAGTPPIVAKGCEGEFLLDRFQCGATFEPMDGSDLASAVLKLAGDRRAMVEMSRRAVELSKRFDRRTIAAHTRRTLEALSAGKRVPDTPW